MKAEAEYKNGLVFSSPSGSTQMRDYLRFRWEYLRRPWGQPPGSEQLEADDDPGTFHLACLKGGADSDASFYYANIIACGRVSVDISGRAQIRGCAVHPDWRMRGVGKSLMKALERRAIECGASQFFLEAREEAVAFYRRLGYEITKPSYLLFGRIQHFTMVKPTIATRLTP